MIKLLTTENSFNKTIKRASRGEGDAMFLFLSPDYDAASKNLRRSLKENNHKIKSKLYIVDSFITPHAFVAHNTTQVPTLVTITDKKKRSESYLPFIYDRLGVVCQ
jgi:hypothetical protein